jgi:hypothetical protein
VLEASFLNLSDRRFEDGAVSVRPAWEVQESDGATSWFQVRLQFTDGARVDALAVVSAGCLSIEDVRAQPALSLADLTVLADWIEEPLSEACGIELREEEAYEEETPAEGPRRDGTPYDDSPVEADARTGLADVTAGPGEDAAPRRARPSWPRGVEGRWLIAQEYRAAQEEGLDPVLAVMCATGHSRRRSLRLISQARDAGFLTPRHARR